MARFVVEMVFQYEVETPDVRKLVTGFVPPVMDDKSRVVEVLGSKVTYFMAGEDGEA